MLNLSAVQTELVWMYTHFAHLMRSQCSYSSNCLPLKNVDYWAENISSPTGGWDSSLIKNFVDFQVLFQ